MKENRYQSILGKKSTLDKKIAKNSLPSWRWVYG